MKKQKDKKQCPSCKGEFVPRRENMRFCHASCRIEFNNVKNNDKRRFLGRMEKQIAKNYAILKSILKEKQEKIIHSEFLKGAGFNFEVMTHVHGMDRDKNIIAGCHDYHYFKINNQYFKIRKND